MTILTNQMPDIIDSTMELGVNELNTKLVKRVFEDNQKVDGSSLGAYKSEAYLKYRATKKHSNTIRNFQLDGNLIKSIKNLKTEKGWQIAFVGESNTAKPFSLVTTSTRKRKKQGTANNPIVQEAVKGRGLEERLFGKVGTVFAFSDDEVKDVVKIMNDYYLNQISDVLAIK